MKFILTIILFLSFIGCNRKNYVTELIPTGKVVSIYLTSETRNFSNCIRYFKADAHVSYLVLSNLDFNRIEFYNWDTGILSHKIDLMKVGPDGIGSLRGFEILSQDSILIFNAMADRGRFFLINSNGKILKKYDISSTNSNYPLVPMPPSSVMNNSPNIKNNIATFPSLVMYQLDKSEEITNWKLLAQIDLITDTIHVLNLYYPLLTNRNQETVNPDYSSIYANRKWIFSFTSSDDIFIVEDLNKIIKKTAKSNYIKSDFISNSVADNWNFEKIISSPLYKSIYYDSVNNVYYRFAKLGDEFNPRKDFFSQNRYPQNTSVIILNSGFDIIGETKLPIDRYVMNMSFMTPEGLYISKSNVYSNDFCEDTMNFELFTIN